MFVIQRTADGGTYQNQFVAVAGRKSSYTPHLQFAQRFQTKESAEANQCVGNEKIVPLDEAFSAPEI